MNSSQLEPLLLKIIVVGNSGVGKSSVIQRYVRGDFQSNYAPTIGLEYCSKNLFLEKEKQIVSLQIWDTMGQERFKALTVNYYRNAIGAILIFDITNKQSFINIAQNLKEIDEFCDEGIIKLLVGNKFDIEEKREVSKEEAVEFAKKNKLGYFEVSAKRGDNIEDAFLSLAKEIVMILSEQDQTTIQNSYGYQFSNGILNNSAFDKNSKKIQQVASQSTNQSSRLTSNSKSKKKKQKCC